MGHRQQDRRGRGADDQHVVDLPVLGSAWPRHTNRTMAQAMQANIQQVGLPEWSEADVALAKASQRMLRCPEVGLATGDRPSARARPHPGRRQTRRRLRRYRRHHLERADRGSELSLEFPGGPGHNWANAIPMATPIAHKGVNAGARVQALTALDLLLRPDLLAQARDYFDQRAAQAAQVHAVHPSGRQARHLDEQGDHGQVRPEMRKVLFRSGEVQDVSGSDEGPVRLRLPDADATIDRNTGLGGPLARSNPTIHLS